MKPIHIVLITGAAATLYALQPYVFELGHRCPGSNDDAVSHGLLALVAVGIVLIALSAKFMAAATAGTDLRFGCIDFVTTAVCVAAIGIGATELAQLCVDGMFTIGALGGWR